MKSLVGVCWWWQHNEVNYTNVGVCVCTRTPTRGRLVRSDSVTLDCCPPVSSVHGILQARILEWAAISSSKGSSRPRSQTRVSWIGRRILYHWATKEALNYTKLYYFKMVKLLNFTLYVFYQNCKNHLGLSLWGRRVFSLQCQFPNTFWFIEVYIFFLGHHWNIFRNLHISSRFSILLAYSCWSFLSVVFNMLYLVLFHHFTRDVIFIFLFFFLIVLSSFMISLTSNFIISDFITALLICLIFIILFNFQIHGVLILILLHLIGKQIVWY